MMTLPHLILKDDHGKLTTSKETLPKKDALTKALRFPWGP